MEVSSKRLAVATAASKDAELYFFDEPSSYNDVYQRMAVAGVIRELAQQGKITILVEHDLAFLDYLSDYIHILYGSPGAYGIVSGIQAARTGINLLLDGYLPEENVRFRENPVTFDVFAPSVEDLQLQSVAQYTNIVKTYPGFRLTISEGELRQPEVLGILGANALGKTTFLKIIAAVDPPDEGTVLTSARISYKPQYLDSDVDGDVRGLLNKASGEKLNSSIYGSDSDTPKA